jgi:hypothetical protein
VTNTLPFYNLFFPLFNPCPCLKIFNRPKMPFLILTSIHPKQHCSKRIIKKEWKFNNNKSIKRCDAKNQLKNLMKTLTLCVVKQCKRNATLNPKITKKLMSFLHIPKLSVLPTNLFLKDLANIKVTSLEYVTIWKSWK